jgi:hypothetical protein
MLPAEKPTEDAVSDRLGAEEVAREVAASGPRYYPMGYPARWQGDLMLSNMDDVRP